MLFPIFTGTSVTVSGTVDNNSGGYTLISSLPKAVSLEADSRYDPATRFEGIKSQRSGFSLTIAVQLVTQACESKLHRYDDNLLFAKIITQSTIKAKYLTADIPPPLALV